MKLTDFAGQNWVITPAALAVGQPAPTDIHQQMWLLVLSGVVFANFKGTTSADWRRETLSFSPELAGPQNAGPLNWAISRYSIPTPSNQNFVTAFSLEQWAPFASLSSIFNEHQSVD